ncbi:unnamed protein product [Clonostachys rhizophaga]|uniref:Heterokaryon incompatibility domain-containing protein n=1 Tax=Clonostachys rhizophaga TaxID=160324 RepID=A0A9N9YVI3_9HYPO|nr:unnamed protein product [Clonostachys rhizophaga]
MISLTDYGSTIGVDKGPNLLSIYKDPDSPGTAPYKSHQIGLPQLPEPGTPSQLQILSQWIRLCDSSHTTCVPKKQRFMPTRLLDTQTTLRLVESKGKYSSRYVALSHCWGQLGEGQMFRAFHRNMNQLKAGIDIETLPATFRDAVTITRGLGVQYLWIDSICIIQDDSSDWETESHKMEDVFSCAYFTISASSSPSSLAGFLTPRTPRTSVHLSLEGSETVYVTNNIDDFDQDVEQSVLNSRGWVFQERALSRRTLYFTSGQVYWECGAGVYCETLASLKNSRAAFLGDPHFPSVALKYHRGGKQVLIQDLYERYSRLSFTYPTDRAVAILGLQQRLGRAFRTKAAYGLLEAYVARGLLWMRDQKHDLKKIVPAVGKPIPSWSWFSQEGSIRYMKLEFERVSWSDNVDFQSPFRTLSNEESSHLSRDGQRPGTNHMVLRGLARKMIFPTLTTQLEGLVFDQCCYLDPKFLRVVIIGRDKIQDGNSVHGLVIQPTEHHLDNLNYSRVGVASLRGSQVEADGEWVNVR